jgi:hypothetical protein
MAVCPWCKADVVSSNAACSACGKRAIDAPARAPSLGPPAGAGQVPELELSPRSRRGAPDLGAGPSLPPASRRESQDPVAIPGVGGVVFDEDDIFSPGGGVGGSLELQHVHGVPSGSLAAAVPPSGLVPPLRSPERFQRSSLARGSEPTADETDARALADYGDGPSSFWQAPLYAYRVRTRQSELRRQLAERQRDLTRARDACEEAKVAFAERARNGAQKNDTFAKLLEPIVATERVMLDRDTALSVATEAHQGQLRVIDERIAELEAELADAKADERQIEDKLAEAEAVRQRALAKMKRVEIEIRNAGARADAESSAARVSAKGVGTHS